MFKYQISASREQTPVWMRLGSTVRAVGVQTSRVISIWAEVPDDLDRPEVMRTFQVVPTGGDVPTVGIYIGTVLDGLLVWHIYEVVL